MRYSYLSFDDFKLIMKALRQLQRFCKLECYLGWRCGITMNFINIPTENLASLSKLNSLQLCLNEISELGV